MPVVGSILGDLWGLAPFRTPIPSVGKLEPGKRERAARCVDKASVREWEADLAPSLHLEFSDSVS